MVALGVSGELSGVVLAGGRSSRFGSDKARHLYRGKTLLTWALEALAEADERLLIANHPYPEAAVPTYADLIPGGGAMSGLYAALHHARCDWVALSACDMPLLSPAYWRLLAGEREGVLAVVGINATGRTEPLAALYHRALKPLVERKLAGGEWSMQRFLAEVEPHTVPWEKLGKRFGAELFLNANRPTDIKDTDIKDTVAEKTS